MKKQLSGLLILSAFMLQSPAVKAELPNMPETSSAVTSSFSQKIDLNTANVSELQTLPGVGVSKAEAIIAYRESVGPFLEIAQITEVKGIGEKMLSKLKNHVVVND